MGRLVGGQLVPLRTEEALRVQKLHQKVVALLLIKQVVNWKLEHQC